MVTGGQLGAELERRFFEVARGVAGCPNIDICRGEFLGKYPEARTNERRHFASVPSPDFIGSRYSGLVIIGGNPGLAHQGVHYENDRRMFDFQRRVAAGDQEALTELLAFLPSSMAHWPQVVDTQSRLRLGYDIEDIAYIDIVKCGSAPAKGDTRSLFARTKILERCWKLHTRQLLELLQPTHILALWKPILGVLDYVGYPLHDKVVGYHTGARHLTKDARYAMAHGVVDDFYARAALDNDR